MKVAAANLENGLLSVELVREVPEEMKPRRIEIGSPPRTISGQDNRRLNSPTRIQNGRRGQLKPATL